MQSVRTYNGLRGLNISESDFAEHVMQPQEILAFFGEGKSYNAIYTYPQQVTKGFSEPPVFSAASRGEDHFILQANIVNNSRPGCLDCTGLFAKLLLAAEYTARDRIQFAEDEEHGFSAGTCRITTQECVDEGGNRLNRTEKLVRVENRPAVFLKVRNSDTTFYEDIAIFFPAQIGGLSHYPVRNGEAFVLVNNERALNSLDIANIKNSFEHLVNTSSYKSGNALYEISSKQPIQVAPDASPRFANSNFKR